MCHLEKLNHFPGPCANLRTVLRSGIMGQSGGMMATSDPETVASFLSFRAMTNTTLLGFWQMASNGLPAERPQWRRPTLPGETEPPTLASHGNDAPQLPQLRYRTTRSGQTVAWDEPSETF